MRNGQLVSLPPHLIRRLKSHFYHIPPPCGPTGVDIILGLNGYVWVSVGTTQEKRDGGEGFDAEGVYSDKNDVGGLCASNSSKRARRAALTFRISAPRVDRLFRPSRA